MTGRDRWVARLRHLEARRAARKRKSPSKAGYQSSSTRTNCPERRNGWLPPPATVNELYRTAAALPTARAASEGWEAINLARDKQPDLILMDIKLPDICGLDVTRRLKQNDLTKSIPIIAVSAWEMNLPITKPKPARRS